MLCSAVFLPVSVLLNPGVSRCLPVTLLHLVRALGSWPRPPHLKMGGGSWERGTLKGRKRPGEEEKSWCLPYSFLQSFRWHKKDRFEKTTEVFGPWTTRGLFNVVPESLNSILNPLQYPFQFSSILLWLPRHLLRIQANGACMSNEPSGFSKGKKGSLRQEYGGTRQKSDEVWRPNN